MGKHMLLEKLTNLCLIVTCAVVASYAGSGLYRNTVTMRPPQAYKPGEKINDTADLKFGNASKTLLLTTRSTCKFCQDSMPFYRSLVATAKRTHTRFVGITAEDLNTNREYLDRNGVALDAVVNAGRNGIRRLGTPDLILVQTTGVVLKSWHGMLDRKNEADVMRSLETQ